jgi:hypothetical protein
MSRKSAVSEYQALELKGGFCSRKETSNAKAKRQPAEAKRERELVKLWPEVQQECRDGYREWIKEHSKADDRVQGIKMLQALIERLQKFGFDQKAKRFERSLFCSDAEGVPSLLDRLRFPRDDGDEFEEWQGVNDTIVEFLASELGAKKPDALQFAADLRNRLDEIEANKSTTTGHNENTGTVPKTKGGAAIEIWKRRKEMAEFAFAEPFRSITESDELFIGDDPEIKHCEYELKPFLRDSELALDWLRRWVEGQYESAQPLLATTEPVEQSPICENDLVASMPRRFQLAYLAAKHAEHHCGRSLTDLESFQWLNEHGFEDYQLPMQDTFADYLTQARRVMGEQRKTPRSGRTSRSFVRQSEL